MNFALPEEILEFKENVKAFSRATIFPSVEEETCMELGILTFGRKWGRWAYWDYPFLKNMGGKVLVAS
jgi:hypothetical protein